MKNKSTATDTQAALHKTDCSKLLESLEHKLSREYAARDFYIMSVNSPVQLHRTEAKIALLQELIEEFKPIA